MSGDVEVAELSSEDELDGGGAVTVDDDPEEEEEVDLGIGAAAVAGPLDPSGCSVSRGPTVVPESAPEAAGVLGGPSGRIAVPK